MPAYSNANGKPSDLSAQNAALGPIPVPKGPRCSVSMKTGSANPGTADFVLEGDFGDGDWVQFGMLKPSDSSALTSLTGASKAGVVPLNMSAVEQVRGRRTDADGGAAILYLNITADD